MTATLYVTDDSPRELTDGAWVVVKGVARWVAPEPIRPEPLTLVSELVEEPEPYACEFCYADEDEPCVTDNGNVRHTPHAGRVVKPRLCPCGAKPLPPRRYCEPCRIKSRRESWRKYGRKRVRPDRLERDDEEAS